MTTLMPRERILTESDGPFAQIDGRPLFPWDAAAAETTLAGLWGVGEEEVRAQLLANLKRLTTQDSQRSR
jgi:TatD DNase family protein